MLKIQPVKTNQQDLTLFIAGFPRYFSFHMKTWRFRGDGTSRGNQHKKLSKKVSGIFHSRASFLRYLSFCAPLKWHFPSFSHDGKTSWNLQGSRRRRRSRERSAQMINSTSFLFVSSSWTILGSGIPSSTALKADDFNTTFTNSIHDAKIWPAAYRWKRHL